ncbi:MAG: hypothetical protein M3R54_02520 [Chloroflexota bacterium]|nr:hypothetical protein [Chloroflexota bacterium]
MSQVWVPGLGFRSSDGLGVRDRVVVNEGDRAFALMTLISTERGTEVVFEIKDDKAEDLCIVGKLDHDALSRIAVTLRDGDGNSYAMSKTLLASIGIGQHDFGFFHRETGFEPLRPDVRHVVLQLVGGELGDWTVPIDVLPLDEVSFIPIRGVDAGATREDVLVRVTGIATGGDQTWLQLEASASTPAVAIRGIGAVMQRQGDDRLVLLDGAGRRYEEELARESVRRRFDNEPRWAAKFPPLPPEATELTLIVPAIVIEESDASLEFTLPVTERRDVEFGRYPMVLVSAGVARDLPAPPGEPPASGLRIALGARDVRSPRRVVCPSVVALDGGAEKRWGWGSGWHPEPGFMNITIDVDLDALPRTIRLARPLVRVDGPWEIKFARPAS